MMAITDIRNLTDIRNQLGLEVNCLKGYRTVKSFGNTVTRTYNYVSYYFDSEIRLLVVIKVFAVTH